MKEKRRLDFKKKKQNRNQNKIKERNKSSKTSIIVLVPTGLCAFQRAGPFSWLGRLWLHEDSTCSGNGY